MVSWQHFDGTIVFTEGGTSWTGPGTVLLIDGTDGGRLVAVRHGRGAVGHTVLVHDDLISSVDGGDGFVVVRTPNFEFQLEGDASLLLASALSG